MDNENKGAVIRFSTSDRTRALGFMRLACHQPELQDTPESMGPLLDLVAQDIVRIDDPEHHSPATVIPGNNWHEKYRALVVEACKKMKGGVPESGRKN